jgi:hypothetical protein
MQARMGAEADRRFPGAAQFMSERAADVYAEHPDGLFLYSPSPDVLWTGFTVAGIDETERGVFVAEVEIREAFHGTAGSQGGPGEGLGPRSLRETVRIGPGRRYDGTAGELLVLEATREIPTATRVQPAWFVYDFLVMRASRAGAEEFLSPSGREAYESRANDIHLYTDIETGLGDLVISELMAVDGDALRAVVRLSELPLGDSPICPRTEVLRLEAPAGGGDGWAITDASREYPGWDVAPLDEAAAREFVCAFVAPRLEQTEERAEAYLSDEAAADYDAGEGGLRLYAPDGSHWGFWWILDSDDSVGEDIPGAVLVTITLNNTGQEGAIFEHLLIGPGTNTYGNEVPAVVLSAAIADCEEQSNTCT